MKTLSFFLFVLFTGCVYGQEEEIPVQPELPTNATRGPEEKEAPAAPQNGIYDYVDEPASFPGGIDALRKFLAQNMIYPMKALEAEIQGKVYLRFVVDKEGTISNVKVVRGIPKSPECDAEAVRVVEKMPKWIPGKVNGKEVDSYYNLPLTFKLQ